LASLAKTYRQLRLLHFMFVRTWFLFILCVQIVKPQPRAVQPMILYALAALAITDVASGVALRKKRVDAPMEVLRSEPENAAALAQWRGGNIFSFAQAETVTLFGVALKFLGASWLTAGFFFFVGLVLILLWTPRLDLASV
jgi:hypothetical protein